MTVYVQRWTSWRDIKTVAEFKTWKEAREMTRKYQLSDPSAKYYTSRSPCRAWRESTEPNRE